MNLMTFFTEPLSYDFMVRALATSLIAATVCAAVSYTHLTLPTNREV